MESERILVFSQELRLLDEELCGEVRHMRISPVCRNCANLARERDSDNAIRKETQNQLRDLKSELDEAASLINSLQDEARKTSDENQRLKQRIESLEKELSSLRSRAPSSLSSSNPDLESERRLRIKIQAELEMYKRQTKSNDVATLANARRVAIALASHCVELSRELADLKGHTGSGSSTLVNSVQFFHARGSTDIPRESRPITANLGWDTADDDLFDSLG